MSENVRPGAEHERREACKEIEPLLVLLACGELGATEREAAEAHIEHCAACAASLVREMQLLNHLAEAEQPADRLDPAGLLLSQCRSELAEALDDLEAERVGHGMHPLRWVAQLMALRPATATVMILVMGATVGLYAARFFRGAAGPARDSAAMNVVAAPRLSEQDLAGMEFSGIDFIAPGGAAGTGTIELRLRAERPMVISGSVEDSDVRRVLTYVVENGQRFDPGARLDCLEALRSRSADADVRRALILAARKDRNPAVRLKALDALRDAALDDSVRDLLVDALANDPNPGVRIEAVNSLVRSLPQMPTESSAAIGDPGEQRVLRVLQNLMRKDPNQYVRMQSETALRRLGPRQLH